MKCRQRNKKVSTYAGISEFALSMVYYFQHVDIMAYDIIRSDGWREKRQSKKVINISRDGVDIKLLSNYTRNHWCIDVGGDNRMIIDGVDFV